MKGLDSHLLTDVVSNQSKFIKKNIDILKKLYLSTLPIEGFNGILCYCVFCSFWNQTCEKI